MSTDITNDTMTVTVSRLLTGPHRQVAILLVGHLRGNEPYSVALEVTHEMLSILRTEVQKAESYLSRQNAVV